MCSKIIVPGWGARSYFVIIALLFSSYAGFAQSWTQLSPSGTPPVARSATTGGYDPASNRMIVFGGRDGSGNNLNDVWVLTNANGLGGPSQWINLIPNGTAGSPPARSGHSAAYDATNNVLVIFGGCSGSCAPALNDTWVLSNANGLGGTPVWTQLGLEDNPPPRANAAAAYGASINSINITNAFYIYGGQDGSGNPCSTFSELWLLFNPTGLTGFGFGWNLFRVDAAPLLPGLSGASAVYDAQTSTMTVFGGTAMVDGVCQDTNVVLQLPFHNGGVFASTLFSNGAAGSPPARSYASAVFDATGGRMLVFGGEQNGAAMNDTWSLSSATGLGSPSWSQLSTAGTPPPEREGHAAIFDSSNQRMTIFGGSNSSGVLNDVWVLTAPGVSPLSCATNPANPDVGRYPGLTEVVGDMVLTCTGGTPTPSGQPIPQYNVLLTLNTSVTSRPLPEAASLSEALLLIDEAYPANPSPTVQEGGTLPLPSEPPQILCKPLGATCAEIGTGGSPSPYQTQPNIFVGKQVGSNAIEWNIPIDPPGTNAIRYLRLKNVRVNAAALGTPNGFIPTQVTAIAGIGGAATIPVANSQQPVAEILPGLMPAVPAIDPLFSCVAHNASLTGASGSAAFDFDVQLTEGFSSSLKARTYGASIFGPEFPEPVVEQNIPGFPYNTETDFYSPSLFTPAPSIGLADTGTRILLKFQTLPTRTRLFVPVTITLAGNYGENAVGELRLVQANENGVSAPGFQPVAATKMVGTTPVAEVNYAGSTAYVTYDVLYANPTVMETAIIPVAVAFKTGAGVGQVSVISALAPLDTTLTASATAPMPRFSTPFATLPAFSIDKCAAPTLSATILSKSGPKNARVWNIQIKNGKTPAYGVEMTGLKLTRSAGPKCTAAVTSPAFPVSLGDMLPNSSATTAATINFTGCTSKSKFQAVIQLSDDDGAEKPSLVLSFETP
jgi:hypothetical protein